MTETNVKLTVANSTDKLVASAVQLFARRWKDRTQVRLTTTVKPGSRAAWELVVGTVAEPAIRAAIDKAGLAMPRQRQSYAVAATGRTLTIGGADGQGVLYGLGHVLRNLAFEPQRVALPKLRETRTPAVYDRGIYFATHFNNFYEAAPLEKIEHYIEEMALWGFDMIAFWFDTNWFPYGFWNDPHSRGSEVMARIRRIAAKGRSYGMKVLSGGVANEGFANLPPPELRVEPGARHGGFYPDSQICPSKPGGLEMIMDVRRKVMEHMGPVDKYIYAPYDPGGCGCTQCTHAPGRWGRKFLEVGPAITGAMREMNPQVQVFLATWLMDEKEKDMVYALCDQKAGWFQGLLTSVEDVGTRVVDARYQRLVLPEISMFGCYSDSYGCNGANPAPARFAVDAPRVARAGCSTMIYSEGVYEDFNKAVYADLLWAPDRDVAEVVSEYTRYYFGEQNEKLATELIAGLEKTWGAPALMKADVKTVADLAKKARDLKARLPRHGDALLRWRALSDRARMDLLMKQTIPWKELTIESRVLHSEADYLPVAELRRRLKRFLMKLRLRKKQVDQLFEVHWAYMEFFHFEKNIMIFLPDEVLGRYNLEAVLEPLAKVADIRDEARLRREVSRVFKRWYWFLGVDSKYHFL
jgi:hypothetical protein